MRCLKCGNELKDNEIMCSNCGYNRNNTPTQDNQFATRNIGVYNQNPVDQQEVDRKLQNQKEFDELVQIYMGDKYYNFRKGSFSFCAFFFGPLYFLYRKLYAVAIIIFAMLGGVSAFFTITTQGRFDNIRDFKELITIKGYSTYMIVYFVTLLAFYIFLGITFKKFYFNEIVERIRQSRIRIQPISSISKRKRWNKYNRTYNRNINSNCSRTYRNTHGSY